MCHKINIINFTSSGTILMLGNQQKKPYFVCKLITDIQDVDNFVT